MNIYNVLLVDRIHDDINWSNTIISKNKKNAKRESKQKVFDMYGYECKLKFKGFKFVITKIGSYKSWEGGFEVK